MPTFEIEQYELHSAKYRVQADSEAEAIAKLFAGEGEAVDNSLEYIEVADDYGLPVEEFPELAEALQYQGVRVGEDIIASIRSIEKVCCDEDSEPNVPCVACGRKDLPLHISGRCGVCGPSPTAND